MDRELRDTLRRVVREELMRLVGQASRPHGSPPRTADTTGPELPSVVLLTTGVTPFPDAWVPSLAGLADRLELQGLWAEKRTQTAMRVEDLATRLEAGGLRLREPAGVLAACGKDRDSFRRQASKARALVVAPCALDTVAAAASGQAGHPAAGMILLFISLQKPVYLLGSPTRAEGWSIKPGHPLFALAEEQRRKLQQLGPGFIRSGDLGRALGLERESNRYVPPGKDRPALEFYTAHDIEDMAARGERRLILDARSRLTPAARDRASELGVEIIRPE